MSPKPRGTNTGNLPQTVLREAESMAKDSQGNARIYRYLMKHTNDKRLAATVARDLSRMFDPEIAAWFIRKQKVRERKAGIR